MRIRRTFWYALMCVVLHLALLRPASAAPPSLEQFFASPQLTHFKISPDGKHAAAIAPRDDDWRLVVLSLDPIGITQEISLKKFPIADFWWVNEERLLLSVRYKDGREVRLAGVNRTGGRPSDFSQRLADQRGYVAQAFMLNVLPSRRDSVLVHFYLVARSGIVATEAVRFNAYTGRYTAVAGRGTRAFSWLTDPAGELRFAYAQLHGDGYYLYREPKGVGWRSIKKIGEMDVDRLNLVPLGFSDERKHPLVISRHALDRFSLYELNVDELRFSEVIHELPDVDLAGPAVRSRNGKLEGLRYRDDDWKVYWLEPSWRKRAALLERSLPGVSAHIVSWDDAHSRFVVRAESSRRPPVYLLYTEKPPSLKPLASLHPELPSEGLVDTQRITYRSGDERQIPGYLTLPAGAEPENLPLVVVVHDGPWTARSGIRFRSGRVGTGFDPEIQFLASRGWAVLQPNYRGSTGYGLEHEVAGFGQWGRRMQDDIADGVRWLVAEGIADPKRVCIYGKGYGGLAAAEGLVRTPALYRCGVAYNGIYDLPKFAYDVEWYVYSDEVHLRMGSNRDALAGASPVHGVDRLRAPLLVVHGDEGGSNWVWAEGQFEAMIAALEKAKKPHERMKFGKYGQGLRRERDRLRYYARIEAFLSEHLAAP